MQNIRRGGPYKLIRQKRRALRHTMRSYLHTSKGRPARDERTAQANFQETKPGGFRSCGGGILYLLLSQPELGGRVHCRSRHFPGQNNLFFISGVYTRRVFKRRQAVPDTAKRPEGNLSRSFVGLHHCLRAPHVAWLNLYPCR